MLPTTRPVDKVQGSGLLDGCALDNRPAQPSIKRSGTRFSRPLVAGAAWRVFSMSGVGKVLDPQAIFGVIGYRENELVVLVWYNIGYHIIADREVTTGITKGSQ